MGKRRFEFEEGGSAKFWELEQLGSDLHIGWGKRGTKGQSQVKSFASEAKADQAAQKLIKEKTGKGYVEREGGGEAATDGGARATGAPTAAEAEPTPKPAAKAPKKAAKKGDAAPAAAGPSMDGVTLPNGKPLGARAVSNLLTKLETAEHAGQFGEALYKAASYGGQTLLHTIVERGLFRPKTHAQLSWMKHVPAQVSPALQAELLAAVETTPLDGVSLRELLEMLQSVFQSNRALLSPDARKRPLRDACVLILLMNGIEVPQAIAREGQDTILGWLQSMPHWGVGTAETRAAAVLFMCDPKAVRSRPGFAMREPELRAETLRALLASGPLELGADPGRLPETTWQHVFSVRKEPASAFFGTGQLDLTNEGLRRASAAAEVPIDEETPFFSQSDYIFAVPALAIVGTARLDAQAERVLAGQPDALTKWSSDDAGWQPSILMWLAALGLPFSDALLLRILDEPRPHRHNPAVIDPYEFVERFRSFRSEAIPRILPLLAQRAAEAEGRTALGLRLALVSMLSRMPAGFVVPVELDEYLRLDDVFQGSHRDAAKAALNRLPPQRAENILVRDMPHLARDRQSEGWPARPHEWVQYVRGDASPATVRRVARTIAENLRDDQMFFEVSQSAVNREALGAMLVETLKGQTLSESQVARLKLLVPSSADALTAALAKPIDVVEEFRQITAAHPGPSSSVYLLAVDPGAPVGLSRVGGLPAGLAPGDVPRYRGRKLAHAFTLELSKVPELATRFPGARTVSFFVQAYNEDSPRGQLHLTRTDAELSAVPDAPGSAKALKITALTAPSSLFDTKNEGALGYARGLLLSAPGFVLGGPVWLQGGKDGADPDFLAQYDERLAPGVNLGDTGICYSFADRADWQCL